MKLKKTALFAFVFGMVLGAFADWRYDPSAGTITDADGWVFQATVEGKAMTVGACDAAVAAPAVLDFSCPVSDEAGTNYTIVALDTRFGRTSDADGHCADGTVTTNVEGGDKISALVLPQTLKSIGSCAFALCPNLVQVTPFLPDALETLGEGAFYETPVAGDLRLIGMKRVIGGSTFQSAKVTSVTFGPSLQAVECPGGDRSQLFYDVTTITNIVFSLDGSGIAIHPYALAMPSTLAAPLKLSGVASVGDYAFENLSFARVEFDDGIVSIGGAHTFLNNTLLAVVSFRGNPPAVFDLTYNGVDRTVMTYCRRKCLDAWKSLAEGEVVNMESSAFAEALCAAYSTTASKRPLRFADKSDGFVLGYR